MDIIKALRSRFGKSEVSAADAANAEMMAERERVAKIRERAKRLADAEAAKKKTALSWSGSSYSGKIKGTVDELER